MDKQPQAVQDDVRDAARWREFRRGKPLQVIVPTPTDDKPHKKVTVQFGPNLEESYPAALDAAVDAALRPQAVQG